MTSTLVFFLALGAAAGDDLASSKGHWPGFQGPLAANVTAEQLPLEWSPENNIAWHAIVPGYGQSSPVVQDGRAYVTSISGKMKENCHVTAWDVAIGELLWQQDFESATQVENTGYVSKAAPSPVADARGTVALFEGGNLVALSSDGSIRWQRNLVDEFGPITSRHGLGSSLVQTDRLAIAWIERDSEPYLVAVDKESGENVWKSEGLGSSTWSTPALLRVDSETHVVLSASGLIAGFDVNSGRRLWTLDGLQGNTVPSPQPAGNGRLLLGATEGRGAEQPAAGEKSNGLVEISRGDDGDYQARFVWQARRATSSFGSPIAHRGLAYFVNRAGVLYCLDLENGDEKYAQRLPESVWCTPLAVDDRIYLFGKSGTTSVIRPGPEFELLAENTLWPAETESSAATEVDESPRGPPSAGGPVLYAAAAIPGRLLVRTGNMLYCIEKE